jgi:CheY-like chemotaxis protein
MQKTLHILVVEDSLDDTELLMGEVQRGGYEPVYERVETAESLQAALNQQKWDIIISDYRMPHFSGLDALSLLQKEGHDIPFILVSGVIGEDQAVAAMKAGAQDYLMKDRLARLVPVIERELREAKIRCEQRQAEAELKRLQQEREQHSLDQISRQPQTSITAKMYGSRSLRKISPDHFGSLSKRYSQLIDMALEQRTYKVSYSFSDELRDLAQEMGAIRISPRDVVEIHNATLRQKRREVTQAKATAYIEEGRLMLLELMGYLVAYYRNYAFGTNYSSIPMDERE